MTVSLRDARNNASDLAWIGSVYRDYLDDLGLLNTGIFPALGEIGHREPDQLQRWLVDRSAALLTILDDQQPVGFAMVARETHASRVADFRMAEFFVARTSRRRGVGPPDSHSRALTQGCCLVWPCVHRYARPRSMMASS